MDAPFIVCEWPGNARRAAGTTTPRATDRDALAIGFAALLLLRPART